jgi:hypothetical protein
MHEHDLAEFEFENELTIEYAPVTLFCVKCGHTQAHHRCVLHTKVPSFGFQLVQTIEFHECKMLGCVCSIFVQDRSQS